MIEDVSKGGKLKATRSGEEGRIKNEEETSSQIIRSCPSPGQADSSVSSALIRRDAPIAISSSARPNWECKYVVMSQERLAFL